MIVQFFFHFLIYFRSNLFLIKECGNPNKQSNVCIKPQINGKLKECTGFTNHKCGVFCTNSPLVCARKIITITNQIASVMSQITGGVKLKAGKDQKVVNTQNRQKYPSKNLDNTQKAKAQNLGSSKLQKISNAISEINNEKAPYDNIKLLLEIIEEAGSWTTSKKYTNN